MWSNAHRILEWFTDYHDMILAVCALLTRDLTPEERIQFNISNQSPICP
jgi:hypothetical protein